MKTLVVGLVAGALTALAMAGCSNAPSLKQGDCAVIGSDGSIHQVSCRHPPQPQIYYVAQVTTGSCTVAADNEVTQNGEMLCLRQVYDTGSSAPPAPPSTAPTQAALPAGARYLGPITRQDIGDGYCTGVGREPILRHPNAYGWICGHQGSVVRRNGAFFSGYCLQVISTAFSTSAILRLAATPNPFR